MSYNDDNRRGGHGQDEGNYGGGQSGGYGSKSGEAQGYYNEGQRPSEGHDGGRRHDDDDHRVGERRYDDDNSGAGYGSQHGGGRRYNDGNSGSGDGYGGSAAGHAGGGGYGEGGSGYDQDEVVSQALRHGNDEDGNIFSQAMSFLGQNKHSNEDVNEQQMIGAHQQLYGNQSSSRPHDANTLGAGAAMQALKMFTGGGAGGGEMGSHGPGNNSQSQFIGMAMAQAGKVFDQQNGQGNVAAGADKQSAVNTAAKLALQMYMKSEGKGGGGGPGGLLGLASKYM
jgi:hypothetical protein